MTSGGPMVMIALLGWVPLVLVLFAVVPARRAVIASFVAGYMFLPMGVIEIPGVPNFGKTTATSLGVLMGVFLFDGMRVAAYRFRWFDVPMLVWSVVPMASSLTNGLGAYDGASATFAQVMEWSVPYFAARLYLGNAEGVRDLAIALVIGGIVYVPLCLYEIRMSPQLHRMVYGYHQHQFAQTKRFGGFRPTVFMQHGLAVGMWMTASALSAVWLWASGNLRRLFRLPMSNWAGGLLLIALACKSFGALVLLVWGIGAYFGTKWLRTRLVLAVLLLMPALYVGLRATEIWSARNLVEIARDTGGEERAGSLRFRLDNEDVLIERAMEQPVFGWGGWGRNRPEDDREGVITDGLWVIVLGQRGLVGLGALMTFLLLPVGMGIAKMEPRAWVAGPYAPAGLLAVIVLLFTIDCLPNAMLSPVYVLAAGAAMGAIGAIGQRGVAARPVVAGGGGVMGQGSYAGSARMGASR